MIVCESVMKSVFVCSSLTAAIISSLQFRILRFNLESVYCTEAHVRPSRTYSNSYIPTGNRWKKLERTELCSGKTESESSSCSNFSCLSLIFQNFNLIPANKVDDFSLKITMNLLSKSSSSESMEGAAKL